MKLDFIHIPKCGGSWLRNAGGKEIKHQGHVVCDNLAGVPVYFKRAWNKIYTPGKRLSFTIIRNPWDLLVSMYFYNFPYRSPRTEKPEPYLDAFGFPFKLFSEFVDAYCDPFYPWMVPAQQENLFFQIYKQGIIVPLVFKLEDLEELEHWLLYQFKVKIKKTDVPNASKHNHYSEYYTPALRDMVKIKCQREIALGGYEFEAR